MLAGNPPVRRQAEERKMELQKILQELFDVGDPCRPRLPKLPQLQAWARPESRDVPEASWLSRLNRKWWPATGHVLQGFERKRSTCSRGCHGQSWNKTNTVTIWIPNTKIQDSSGHFGQLTSFFSQIFRPQFVYQTILSTGHKSTIWILDFSGFQMVTVIQNKGTGGIWQWNTRSWQILCSRDLKFRHVQIWNGQKDVGLQMVLISNRIWNMEALPF